MANYRTEPDVVLVAASQRGDRDALDVLLRRHHDRILAVCRRVTGNAADAADASQEALMAIARGIGRFDGTSAFTTWAYRVATNASLDELRRRGRRPLPTDDENLALAVGTGPRHGSSVRGQLCAKVLEGVKQERHRPAGRQKVGLDLAPCVLRADS